jgi:hypothetical protein
MLQISTTIIYFFGATPFRQLAVSSINQHFLVGKEQSLVNRAVGLANVERLTKCQVDQMIGHHFFVTESDF